MTDPANTPAPIVPDPTPADPPANAPTPPADWEALLATLPDDTRELAKKLHEADHESKVTGLKSALTKERDAAEKASKELRTLAKTVDADTAAKLEKLATEKDAENESLRQESAFYHDAAIAGLQPDKMDRAWLICKNASYFDSRGNPDIAAMKADIPELFAAPQTTTRTNAGTGTGQPAAVVGDFNTNLRNALKG